jgi:hypothetical protein
VSCNEFDFPGQGICCFLSFAYEVCNFPVVKRYFFWNSSKLVKSELKHSEVRLNINLKTYGCESGELYFEVEEPRYQGNQGADHKCRPSSSSSLALPSGSSPSSTQLRDLSSGTTLLFVLTFSCGN